MRGELYRLPPPDGRGGGRRAPTRELAELRATALLAKAKIVTPPVDVQQVAYIAGIALVSYGILGQADEYLMALPLAPAVVGLVVNARHPRSRQRFSIAHGIGHYVLERVPETKELLPIAARGRAYDALERVCNYFAACLLMPANWVAERAERGMTNGELVKAFDVSRAALTGRLRELGYYRQGGRPDVR